MTDTSTRKILYTPSGRAGNYANGGYAANIFKGCDKLCKYCYVPDFLYMDAEQVKTFRTKVEPLPNLEERIERDMKRHGKISEPIFLCFTCDAYPYDSAMQEHTRSVIEIILKAGNTVNILTKAGMVATKDFDLLSKISGNKIGATLTFSDENLSRFWEPKASLPMERLEMLSVAKERGLFTWASIEPVIIPEESLIIMDAAMPFVDEFSIGKWNHDKRAGEIDWHKFAHDAVNLMEKNGKRYLLKDELERWL